MENLKIIAHSCYIGDTGYSNFIRSFLRELSKFASVKVRNYSMGKNSLLFDENEKFNEEPHNDEEYIDSLDKKLLTGQVYRYDNENKLSHIYPNYQNYFEPNIDLVIHEPTSLAFDIFYSNFKITYNMWETTRYPGWFFHKLKKFDQIWVASNWQRENIINQGIHGSKVYVIPHGVDSNIFNPKLKKDIDDKFKFLVFGKWEYRKSTKEIIECFLDEFSSDKNVELVLSIDTRAFVDDFSTTEERLKYYNLKGDNLKIINYLPQNEYVKYLQDGHVFLSCSRGEGWNLPLLEAMACGTPSIYSNCSGQLEFAEGMGIPVKISHMTQAKMGGYEITWDNLTCGEFYEPDFNDLKRVMREVYDNYEFYKTKALQESIEIRNKFTWENSVKIALKVLNSIPDNDNNSLDT